MPQELLTALPSAAMAVFVQSRSSLRPRSTPSLTPSRTTPARRRGAARTLAHGFRDHANGRGRLRTLPAPAGRPEVLAPKARPTKSARTAEDLEMVAVRFRCELTVGHPDRPSLSGNRSVTGQSGSVNEDAERVSFSVLGGGLGSQGLLPASGRTPQAPTSLQDTGYDSPAPGQNGAASRSDLSDSVVCV
jgi:hypothetical protein